MALKSKAKASAVHQSVAQPERTEGSKTERRKRFSSRVAPTWNNNVIEEGNISADNVKIQEGTQKVENLKDDTAQDNQTDQASLPKDGLQENMSI